jgi:hypothetical protein
MHLEADLSPEPLKRNTAFDCGLVKPYAEAWLSLAIPRLLPHEYCRIIMAV